MFRKSGVETEILYLRLTDFGLAKRISKGDKTFTFCGTIEYVCPEMINGSGHTFPVDYWAQFVVVWLLFAGIKYK